MALDFVVCSLTFCRNIISQFSFASQSNVIVISSVYTSDRLTKHPLYALLLGSGNGVQMEDSILAF